MTLLTMIRTWDLTENAEAWFRYQRDLRVFFPSMIVALSAMVAWYALFGGSFTAWDHLTAILLVSALVGVIAYLAYLSFQKTAHEMVIDDDRLEFHFPSLPSVRYKWADPELKLIINDNRSLVRRGRWWGVNPLFAITARIPRRPLVCLSVDAYEALERSAEEHGLRLERSGCAVHFQR